MTTPVSLIDIGKLSEPINTLITRISDAIGVVYEPTRIIRNAKAEAKKDEIMMISQLNIEDIKSRAISRFVNEEVRKQENIESVIELAIPSIKEGARTDEVSIDWLVRFFEHVKLISDTEMKELWAKILSHESNEPGMFSKRTLNIVSELDKKDALMFTNLCKFVFTPIGPLVFDSKNEIYHKYGLHFVNLNHLENIGLIKFNSFSGLVVSDEPQLSKLSYFNKSVEVKFTNADQCNLSIGSVFLTNEGEELLKICTAEPEEEIFNYLIEELKNKNQEVNISVINDA